MGLSLSALANVNPKYALVVVASATASAKEKAGADYVCDGVADEVQFNESHYRNQRYQ